MKRYFLLISALITPLFFVGYSHALHIGYSQHGMGSASSLGPLYTSSEISPFFTADSVSGPFYRPFGYISIGFAFVGDEWTADSSSSDFANAVALLTNGNGDVIGQNNLTLLGSNGSGEKVILHGPGYTDPDFQGSTINQMTLQLNSYSSQYVNDFEWDIGEYGPAYVTTYDYTINYEYVDSAPVPEPTTMLLFGTGLAGRAMKRCILRLDLIVLSET